MIVTRSRVASAVFWDLNLHCIMSAGWERVIGRMAVSVEPELVLDRSKTPPIPSGTMPLQHQVAGHVFGRSNGHIVSKIGQCCCFYFVDVFCNVNLFSVFSFFKDFLCFFRFVWNVSMLVLDLMALSNNSAFEWSRWIIKKFAHN